ncbi:DUF3024 domain-containing protein [Roseixanthobacter pseudopolyaromaticivorans]|uniref:DUF3024 domain-containing protein n=1 Tax=Xanthobacteraceae TaxID=335928 RepID=UPI003729AB62
MNSATLGSRSARMSAHPNELDRRRIVRGLKARRRYRYVEPSVVDVDGGYRIASPCCSRNIDAEGGIIDVALLLFEPENEIWRLFWKNHKTGTWELHSVHVRLASILEQLNMDDERTFWQ